MPSQYTDAEWVVRRWDWFNGGNIVEPKSFCQFWRTVLLWATLASVPVVSQLFLVHLRPTPEPRPLEPRLRAAGGIVLLGVRPLGRSAWWLLWPLRAIVYGAFRLIVSVIAYIDEEPKLKKLLERVLWAAIIIAAAVAIVYLLVLLVLALMVAWSWDWKMFLIISESALIGLAVLASIVYFLGPHLVEATIVFLVAVGRMFVSVWGLFWDVAVTSKRRVCPPMEIVRHRQG